MGLRIGSQVGATRLFAIRQLAQHTARVDQARERLASGRRIVRASDGPAELALAEKLRAQGTGLARARMNDFDALSRAQVGEAALDETSGLLVRVRELAVQAASETIGDRERQIVGDEADALLDEVDRIARVTGFNGMRLLDGSRGDAVDATRSGLGLGSVDLATDASSAASAFDVLDQAIDSVSSQRAGLGSEMNILESRIRQSLVEEENVRAAESRIVDVDYAQETAELAKAQILQQTTIAVMAQERVQDELVLKLIDSATEQAKSLA